LLEASRLAARPDPLSDRRSRVHDPLARRAGLAPALER
jgi:hypothetical protein